MLSSHVLKFGLAVLIVIACPAVAAERTVLGPKNESSAKQAVLLDVSANTILFAKQAEVRMPTSSMSKMMTMYLVFEAIKNGKLKLDGETTISERAWRMEGSRMYAPLGSGVKIEDLIRGVIVQSGNDASVALAEAVAGTEDAFAGRMNAKAIELGLSNSHFVNATGLPHTEHYSTPLDLARLGIALQRDFPEYYHYYSEKEFTYNKIKQGNRNPLLYRNMGVDGIKTGHTETAGFGLTASAVRDGRRLVLVVNGLKDMQERADEPARLLEYGFHEFSAFKLLQAGQATTMVRTWLGESSTVGIAPENDVLLTLPVSARSGLKVALEYQEPVSAPVNKGQMLGKAIISAPGMETLEVPLLAQQTVPKFGFLSSLMAKLHLVFGGQGS